MTAPRRRIVRPATLPSTRQQADAHRLAKLPTQLEKERASLARWMRRLKRAFRAVERAQQRIARIEWQITRCPS